MSEVVVLIGHELREFLDTKGSLGVGQLADDRSILGIVENLGGIGFDELVLVAVGQKHDDLVLMLNIQAVVAGNPTVVGSFVQIGKKNGVGGIT